MGPNAKNREMQKKGTWNYERKSHHNSKLPSFKFFALRVTPPAHPEPDASRMDLKSRFSKRSRRFSKNSRRVSNQRSRANLTEKMNSNNFKVAKKMDAEKWPTSHQKPPKWSPKPSKIEPKNLPNREWRATFFAQWTSGRPKNRKRT